MDAEWSLVCKVIEVGDIRPVLDARIKTSYFADPEVAQVFSWMLDHWNEYTATPSEEAMHHAFPAYSLVPTPEPLPYYINEIRSRHRYSLLTGALDRAQEPLKNGDARTAIKVLSTGLEQTHLEVSDLSVVDLTKTTAERLAFYLSLETMDGMRGIPTGFSSMDRATGGLHPEQLITLAGSSKVGKSVILLIMASAAHGAGYKPMFITFEMSNQEQSQRYDAFRAGISYNRLSAGRLLPEEKVKLSRMMHETEDMHPILFLHDPSSTTTVSALASRTSEHKPDIVFVDGAYLMDAEVPGVEPNSAQALTSITRSLKRMAQRAQIPVVISTQALEWKMRKKKISLNSVGYSSSFGQDSDVVFGLEECDDPAERLLKIVAARNTSQKEVRLRFDWDQGAIKELDDIQFAADDDDDEDDI
jgi:replicative DNA helicase